MKEQLRKSSFSLRKNKYFNLKEKNFGPLLSEIARYKNSTVGSYYSINLFIEIFFVLGLTTKKPHIIFFLSIISSGCMP